MTLLETKQKPITLQHIVSLYQIMRENKDEVNASKLLDLYEKLEENKFIISFTGHFSAGKSSMINALLEEEILPKSPIPTSANIVEITTGNGNARVHFYDEGPKEYKAPYDIEVIKEYCKNKNTVKKIELSTTKKLIPEGCIIVDTPGIDAADDADRIMTESSLHLVDRLFYVMDYNHVQSDVNLHFLKQIQEKGIPFYIIINQVDKHNEMEIPFEAFDHSVKQTFDQWDLKPEKIFYSSLMVKNHVHNEYEEIKATIFRLLTAGKDSIDTVTNSTQQLIEEHKIFLEQACEEKMAEFSDVEQTDISLLEDVKEKLSAIKNKPNKMEEEFKFDLSETLKNAYLMPASLRDKAEQFLESEQKDFKVGLFGSKKKTLAEKEMRLNSFLEDLQKNIESSIQWKLRDKIISLLTKYNISNPNLLEFTKQFSIAYTGEDLLSLVKKGAKVNGDYVLNYTNEVSAHIKGKFKAQAQTLWQKIHQEIIDQTNKEAKIYEQQTTQLERAFEVDRMKKAILSELEEKLRTIEHQLEHPNPPESAWELIEQAIEENETVSQLIDHVEPSIEEKQQEERLEDTIVQNKKSKRSIGDVTQAIEKAIETIQNIQGFQEIIDDLTDKKQRLNNRTLTIALFGAFSAGKSSFANALIGRSILPSSPNPTTAVINRIAPVTNEYKHGTVVIHVKSEETLLDDLASITKDFSPPNTNLEGMVNWIKEKRLTENNEINKTYQSYLRAVIFGFDYSKNDLGNIKTITLDDFANYVTDETKACYIELVTLYYDCSLTQLGITLVDTPGADSVNARHTNVAFDYIKYADAILYVTYYNHALSRADKDFLMQLGRVKETFELDKMFFIINAADLAMDSSELKLVENYVKEQLLQLGIRFPRIFPVSSKLSLENKLNNEAINDQMNRFEKQFYEFINEDLPSLTIESALWDIKRAYEWMNNYIDTVNLSAQERDNYRTELHDIKGRLTQSVNEINASLYDERIVQRIQRQLHYVKERLSIRFHDMYKDKFNPTTINESGQKGMRQIESSLKELVDYTGYELLQELRAVSLRIEAFIKELANDVQEDLSNRMKSIDHKFTLPILAIKDLSTPLYKQAFVDVDLQLFQKAVKRFKGTKAFFEKNEKELMKEEFYTILIPHIENYVAENNNLMDQSYVEQWHTLSDARNEQMIKNINNYIENLLSISAETIDINMLKEKKQLLASLLLEK